MKGDSQCELFQTLYQNIQNNIMSHKTKVGDLQNSISIWQTKENVISSFETLARFYSL
jgi:hypothetical protein